MIRISCWRLIFSCVFLVASSILQRQTASANLNIHNITRHEMRFSFPIPTVYCHTSGHIELPPGSITRLAIASPDRLCTLTRVNDNAKETVPIGRSYHNKKWEAVAGPYNTISYVCNDQSCDVQIPEISKNGDVFELRGFDRNQFLSTDDEAARFFEQASFGVTQNDLKNVRTALRSGLSLMDYFAKWINEQIYDMKITSHRAFWRRRTLPVYETNHREGRATLPCAKGSTWRGYAFTPYDKNKLILVKEIQIDVLEKRYALEVDGKIRTMVDKFALRGYNAPLNFPQGFKICVAQPTTYRRLAVEYNGRCLNVVGGNPSVDTRGIPDPTILTGFVIEDITRSIGTTRIEKLLTKEPIEDTQCELQNQYFFISVNNGNSMQDLIFEPHLILEKNHMTNPLEDGGKDIVISSGNTAQCANAPRTFLNENHCRLSKRVACVSQQQTDSGSLKINPETLKTMYDMKNKFVYAIDGLRVDRQLHSSPCIHGVRTRWRNETGPCVDNMHFETAATFRKVFYESTDKNPYVRDIHLPVGRDCHPHDKELLEMQLSIGQDCWKTTHPDDLSVFDFSRWAREHPGNMQGFNPIRKVARRGGHRLTFPASHEISRWKDFSAKFPYVGRLGDSVPFSNLPYSLKTKSMAELFGLKKTEHEDEYTLVCGSPYETSNVVDLSPSFHIQQNVRFTNIFPRVLEQQRRTIWTIITTSSNDQLRQRVAWALSQIFALSPNAVQYSRQTEAFVTYYDIFVRNAFGNYKDVLREVSFSPMMAQMLSYLDSKSSEFAWIHHREIQFADENYAREVMQLFSIGLEKLNDDGTIMIDSDGNSLPTYNNDDITEYARLWTGFTYQKQRGNTEAKGSSNTIDPMVLQLQYRDQFPKMGLDNKYIGDGYALCADLSPNSFLRRGAKYRLLGNTTHSDILDTSNIETIPRLEPISALFKLLCEPKLNGKCRFPGVVTLMENLPCRGVECSVQDPPIVQVNDNVYYEYVKPACVTFPFSNTRHTTIVVDNEGKIALTRANDSFDTLFSLTYFRVKWQNHEFPHFENNCAGGVCESWGSKCLCRTAAVDSIAFNSEPTREQILSELHIGALSPYMKKYVYSKPRRGFAVFSMNNDFSIDTAFKVKDDFGRTLYLKNMRSDVSILRWDNDAETNFGFRNTPSFYGDSPEVKDALYETDAGLDHYFYHNNTAPFLALRFIQRFGISNPSPRYVQTVSQAFKSGRYQVQSQQGNISFGNGKYGDLSAMVAAILLDSESRETLLDYDSSFGSIREPVIKVIALMRSMEFSPTDGEFTSLYNLDSIIGQMAHDVPSVFSFFLPEYSPPGVLAKASLASPEAMLSQNSIGLLNGMISLINFGMTNCFGGFGDGQNCIINRRTRSTINLPSTGQLTYVPDGPAFRTDHDDFVIENLATMLTSGRLTSHHRDIIKQAYSAAHDQIQGLQMAQRLMILTPEFHQTGAVQVTAQKRGAAMPVTKSCKEYKAVIHIFLSGGCDSFNMLVPHSECKNGIDMYDQYRTVRGDIGLERQTLLQINATSSNQVCDSFGIHEKLPVLKELYDQNELAFLSGIGVMTVPVDKRNYQQLTKTQLFAHNKVQLEISRLDPHQKVGGSGLLGRFADVLSKQEGNKVQAFSIDEDMSPIEGREYVIKAAVNSKFGFQSFNPSPFDNNDEVFHNLELLNGIQNPQSSMYAETWSSSLHQSIQTSDFLTRAQNSVELKTKFPNSNLGRKLATVSKMIASKECRGSNRDLFHVRTGSFDHHADLIPNLENEFEELNEGLASFITELKRLPNDVWDNVAIIVSSDFGRTLTANSRGGSDHGWSGNGFMIGGSVNGGKIVGAYPDDFTDANPLNIGRGRLIPTMPFDSAWHAVAEWLNVPAEEVLPNIRSFPDGMLLRKVDVFVDRADNDNNCSGGGDLISCIPLDEQTDYSTIE